MTFTIAAVTAGSSHVFTLVVNVSTASARRDNHQQHRRPSTTTKQTDLNVANNSRDRDDHRRGCRGASPTPQASLADAAMPPSRGSQQLAILGFAVLLVGVLGASAPAGGQADSHLT